MAINQEILDLSEKIIASGKIVLDDDGTAEVNGELYEENLPEGLTIEAVNKVQEYDAKFNTAVFRAFGKLSNKKFSENAELNRTAMNIRRNIETTGFNMTKVQGRMADGNPKNPAVSVLGRRSEHESFGAVREEIYKDFHEMSSKVAEAIND